MEEPVKKDEKKLGTTGGGKAAPAEAEKPKSNVPVETKNNVKATAGVGLKPND